jgi:hypothetical protein
MLRENRPLIRALSLELSERGRIRESRIFRVLRKVQAEHALMEAHDRQQCEEWYAKQAGTPIKRRAPGWLPE